jgi:four helix bundle protein
LRAFQLADSLTLQIYAATRKFPSEERFGLKSQLRRAAVSVGANIVEGAARPSEAEYVRFLVVAYGSARELEYELSIARRLGLIDPATAVDVESRANEICSTLHGLIKAISARKSRL